MWARFDSNPPRTLLARRASGSIVLITQKPSSTRCTCSHSRRDHAIRPDRSRRPRCGNLLLPPVAAAGILRFSAHTQTEAVVQLAQVGVDLTVKGRAHL